MRKLYFIWFLPAFIFISGCVSMAPVSNSYESAKTLGKSNMEISGSYTADILSGEDEDGSRQTDQSNSNLGLRFGYGISDRLDLKLRYERLLPVISEDRAYLDGVSYFGLSPRYEIVSDKLAGGLELGLYTFRVNETEDLDAYNDSEFAISPKLAYSFLSRDNFDITMSTKLDFFTSGTANLWHLNLGAGLSSDASKWSLRPEIGLIKDLDNFSYYSWYSFGVAFILKINHADK